MRTLNDKEGLITRPAPTNQIATEELANLLKRGRELVAAGDIPAARSVLKLAAEAGVASAALELGATYDPTVLEEHAGTTITPEVAMARAWYLTASELGSVEASKRLERLMRADR
jgi:TPR repeat protein